MTSSALMTCISVRVIDHSSGAACADRPIGLSAGHGAHFRPPAGDFPDLGKPRATAFVITCVIPL
jgi:hypothetical protein